MGKAKNWNSDNKHSATIKGDSSKDIIIDHFMTLSMKYEFIY